VPPLAIVENLNVLENVAPGFVAGQVIAMMHQFGFQGMEKALNSPQAPQSQYICRMHHLV
jgi:hypothetical protein